MVKHVSMKHEFKKKSENDDNEHSHTCTKS